MKKLIVMAILLILTGCIDDWKPESSGDVYMTSPDGLITVYIKNELSGEKQYALSVYKESLDRFYEDLEADYEDRDWTTKP